jgi:hypothetical protein
LALAAATAFLVISCQFLSFTLLTPLEPIAYGHGFPLAESGVHILSGNSDFVVVDAYLHPYPLLQAFPLAGFGGQLLNGEAHADPSSVSHRIEQRSREHGGATYAVA